jgi:hypothetical protein
LDPNRIKDFFYQPKLRPVHRLRLSRKLVLVTFPDSLPYTPPPIPHHPPHPNPFAMLLAFPQVLFFPRK